MDLKGFRENKLKIKTQAEFAKLIGVDQSSISRWEKDPSSITWQVLQSIVEKTGASLQELTGYQRPVPKALDVTNTWEPFQMSVMALEEYLASWSRYGELELPECYQKEYIAPLMEYLQSFKRKPRMAVIGRSDTGKSTIINSLLGAERLPVSWTPTTSIAVYIKDISDRPAYIEEDVWVFRDSLGTERSWDESRLADEDYCRSWKLAAGGIEMLTSFGTRQGENYHRNAGTAVVFLDAPILKTCDIIDLPGFGTEMAKDDSITFATAQMADIIVYLSQAAAFMRVEDISYLRETIKRLRVIERKDQNELAPFCNLFVVASQAHSIDNGNREMLTDILDAGCKNLCATLQPAQWCDREEESGYIYSEKGALELRQRFFAYTKDIEEIYSDFNRALRKTLEGIPKAYSALFLDRMADCLRGCEQNIRDRVELLEGIVRDRVKYQTLLEELLRVDPLRKASVMEKQEKMKAQTQQLCQESIKEFKTYLAQTMTVENLAARIKELGLSNKREDIELFSVNLESSIQQYCDKMLREKTRRIGDLVRDYFTSFEDSVIPPYHQLGIKFDFDGEWRIFGCRASDIFGRSRFSRLGVGMLFSVGASSVSTATCLAFAVSPIGIWISLGLAASLGVAKLFAGGWEKTVAKKIVTAFSKNDFASQYIMVIREYWENVEERFAASLQSFEEQWEQYVKETEEKVRFYNDSQVQDQITCLRSLDTFLCNSPITAS